MADQTIKNKQETAKNLAQGKDAGSAGLNTKASTSSTETNSQTRDIIKQQRNVANVQGVVQQQVFNALFGTKTAPETGAPKNSAERGPSRLRARGAARPEREKREPSKHSSREESSVSAEVREQMAIRAATTRAAQASTVAAASNRNRQAGQAVRSQEPLEAEQSTSDGLQQGLVGTDSVEESIATQARFGIAEDPAQQDRGSQDVALNPEQALAGIELHTSTETQKLLDLVGPEAILTFREKLQQVWVTLDDSAAQQLDVIARMPASLTGATAIELLMVESPQGIHFVAFLKNKNDFEVLATFDRRALLPESPSRQLIEAGLMAYEQLDAVFKEGSQKIEENVKEIATTRGTSDAVFGELQRLMVNEKRRRRKFRQMMDYFIDKLDELDLLADPSESPFVPNNLDKTNSSELDNQEVERELEKSEEEGFTLRPEDEEEVNENKRRRSATA